MTTFDEREHAYEAKFAHDAELRFRAKARRDKAIGVWAAAQLGLSGTAAEDYAKEILRSDLNQPDDASLVHKLLGDFRAKGVALEEPALKKKLVELLLQAAADIEAGN
jgi:hypothetical protein